MQLAEEQISKLELQQDQFRPLMKVLDHVPTIQKNEQGVKQLGKRETESEGKISNLETTLGKVAESSSKGNEKLSKQLAEESKQR